MFCSNCGKDNKTIGKYCEFCGKETGFPEHLYKKDSAKATTKANGFKIADELGENLSTVSKPDTSTRHFEYETRLTDKIDESKIKIKKFDERERKSGVGHTSKDKKTVEKLKIKPAFLISLCSCVALFLVVVGFFAKFYVFTPISGVESKTFFNSENSAIIGVDVTYNLEGMGGRVKIEDLGNETEGINTSAGSLGHAVNITAKVRDVETANIAFNYNPANLGGTDPKNLAIAYYDETLGRMILLEDSMVDTVNNVVSVNTTHFSEYVVVDSNEWYMAWAQSQYIIRDMSKAAKYFNISFAVDHSGSMGGEKMELAKSCTYEFLTNLYDEDIFSVIKFESDATVVIPTSEYGQADKNMLYQKIMEIDDTGGTNISDAIRLSLNSLNGNNDSTHRKLIVLLSDGQSSLDRSLLTQAYDSGVRIISVGIGKNVSSSLLKSIADATEGEYFYVENVNDLEEIFDRIRGAYLGLDLEDDADGDGIPDKIETTGMRNQFGVIKRTDPNNADTDGDGVSDGTEVGSVVIDENISERARQIGIAQYVYFDMISDPTVADNLEEKPPQLSVKLSREINKKDSIITITARVSNESSTEKITYATAQNVNVSITGPDCLSETTADMGIAQLKSGESYELPMINAIHTPNGKDSKFSTEFDSDWIIDEETNIEDGICKEKHIVKVKVTADNCETYETEAKVSFEDKTIIVNGDLKIKDQLKFAAGSTVVVYGNVYVEGKGVLDMSNGGTLNVTGDFVFDSSKAHKNYLSSGEISVGGSAEIKRNFYANGNNVFKMNSPSGKTLNLWDKWLNEDQYFNKVYINGGATDLKFKGKFAASELEFNTEALEREWNQYDGYAKEVLDAYISCGAPVEDTDFKYGYVLNTLNGQKSNSTVEKIVQYALLEWSTTNAVDKAYSSNKIDYWLKSVLPSKGGTYNGVTITPYATSRNSSKAIGAGTAQYVYDGQTYSFSFSSNESEVAEAIQDFADKSTTFAYETVKNEVNNAVKKAYGPYGKYAKIVLDLLWKNAEGKDALYEHLKELGKKDAKEYLKKVTKTEKYFDFVKEFKELYKFANEANTGIHSPVDVVEGINSKLSDLIED